MSTASAWSIASADLRMPILLALVLFFATGALQAAQNEARASALLSLDVVNAQGRRIGTLRDLLIEPAAERVRYALIDGFAYPADKLRRSRGGLVLEEGRSVAIAPGSQPDERLMRATDLIGRNVRFADGSEAGDLRDLMIDLPTGKVEYALVAYEPVIGDPPVGIPLARMQIPAGDGPIVLARETEPREWSGLSVRPSDARRRLQSPYTH